VTDTARYSDYITKPRGNVLTVVLLDMPIYCGVLVFLAGFRHLIRQAWPGSDVVHTRRSKYSTSFFSRLSLI
jgi:hypothetical protein